MEALKAVGNVSKKKKRKIFDADVAIKYIQRLYAIEHLAKNQGLSPEQLVEKRQSEAKPLLEEFKEWLLVKSEQVLPKTLLGKAISYTLGQWPRRIVYLGHACLTPDNNLVENSIRPFVVGRKNWLFYVSPVGAGAAIYSLIETAKANGWEPNAYLNLLFERLPFAQGDQQLKQLLPQYLDKEDQPS